MTFKAFNADQIGLVTAISNELCNQQPGLPFEPSLHNKIIEAANIIVDECARERVYSHEGMTPRQWLDSDDVGLSSRYMITVLASLGHPMPDGNTPRDADDLGRCIRMVKACDLADKIPLLFEMGDSWKRIAENWDWLVNLYEEEKYDVIYSFLKEGE